MKASTLAAFLATACLALPATGADAPTNFDDLKAQGAKRLDKEELQKLIPDSTNTHPSFVSTNTRRFENKADGTLYGTASGAFIRGLGAGTGKWSIDDQARYCVDILWPGPAGSGGGPEKWCVGLWKLGDDIYAVGRGGKIYKHEFKKN